MDSVSDEPWLSFSEYPPDVYILVHGVSFHVNKGCMASRSAKLAKLFGSRHQINLTINSFTDIPADPLTFGETVKFCYGYELNLSADTAIPIACVASYLEMTEDYSPNNLLNKSLNFITKRILPYWNETIKAFKSLQPILPHAQHLGLVHACLKSIFEKITVNPNLHGDRVLIPDVKMIDAKSNVKRKLFDTDQFEDLTSLSLPLFQLAISTLSCSGVPLQHVAQCVYQYAKRWVDPRARTMAVTGFFDQMELEVQVHDKINQKEIIEVVEKLMPNKQGVMHVKYLFQILRSALFYQANKKCRNSLEARIGKQLAEASVEDLCIPFYGYTKESKCDTKCIIRILSHFSSNSLSELEAVSHILEEFLAELATFDNLKKDEFVAILKFLVESLEPLDRPHDGVYRAIDIYLDAHHDFVTETEREDICNVLDVRRMSTEASEHAAGSERLPLRIIAQVLFVGQMRIRQVLGELKEEDEEKCEELAMEERVSMEGRVSELEREYGKIKGEIEKCRCAEGGRKEERKLWKELMNVFGCKNSSSIVECNCHVKKTNKAYLKNGAS